MSQERTREEGVTFVHLTVAVDIDPPASPEVSRVSGTELGRQRSSWSFARLELLEWAMGRQIGTNDRLEEETLAFHVDHNPYPFARSVAVLSLIVRSMRAPSGDQ